MFAEISIEENALLTKKPYQAGYSHILSIYKEYLASQKVAGGLWHCWWHGYFYNEKKYSGKDFLHFIRLADQLSLMHKDYVETLDLTFNDEKNWEKTFSQKLHGIFFDAQDQYAIKQKARDNARIDKLFAYYFSQSSPENSYTPINSAPESIELSLISGPDSDENSDTKNKLKKYYHATLNEENASLENLNLSPKDQDKLKHDVKLLCEISQKEYEQTQAELEKLKNNIEHTLLQIDITESCIKKATENERLANNYKTYLRKARNIENHFKKLARISMVAEHSSTIVSFGEGTVSAYGIFNWIMKFSFAFNVPLAIISASLAFFGGWICNYLLLRADTENTLKQIFIIGIFKTNDGETISDTKKVLVVFLGVIPALSSGIAYGALCWGASSNLLAKLIGVFVSGKGVAITSGILAAIPAVGATLCFASIFFVVIRDFIVEDRHLDIAHYFSTLYLHLKILCNAKAFGSAFLYLLGEIIKISLGLALNIAVTLPSVGVFHSFGLKLFSKVMSSANIFSGIIAWITGLSNSVFIARKVQNQINFLGETLLGSDKTFSKANTDLNIVLPKPKQSEIPIESKPEVKLPEDVKPPETPTLNPLQEKAAKNMHASKVWIYLSILLNAVGQAFLIGSEANELKKILPSTNKNTLFGAAAVGTALGNSAGPNIEAANEELSDRFLKTPVRRTGMLATAA